MTGSDTLDGVMTSTYVDAAHGPLPCPEWVITDARATDVDHGVLKSGKEADVSLLERRLDVPGEPSAHCLLAVKRYRDHEHADRLSLIPLEDDSAPAPSASAPSQSDSTR